MRRTFDKTITIEDGEREVDIEVTLYYEFSSPDSSVGYNGGMEEYGFESSDNKEFNLQWLEAKLKSDKAFADQIERLIIDNIEEWEDYDPEST